MSDSFQDSPLATVGNRTNSRYDLKIRRWFWQATSRFRFVHIPESDRVESVVGVEAERSPQRFVNLGAPFGRSYPTPPQSVVLFFSTPRAAPFVSRPLKDFHPFEQSRTCTKLLATPCFAPTLGGLCVKFFRRRTQGTLIRATAFRLKSCQKSRIAIHQSSMAFRPFHFPDLLSSNLLVYPTTPEQSAEFPDRICHLLYRSLKMNGNSKTGLKHS